MKIRTTGRDFRPSHRTPPPPPYGSPSLFSSGGVQQFGAGDSLPLSLIAVMEADR